MARTPHLVRHFSPLHAGQIRAWRLSHAGDSRPAPLHRQHATSGQNRHAPAYADATMSTSTVRPLTVAPVWHHREHGHR